MAVFIATIIEVAAMILLSSCGSSGGSSATVSSVPSTVTNLAAAASTGTTSASVVLTWTAPSGNYGTLTYQIYKGTTAAGVTLYVSGVTATTYTDTSVAAGTKYYYVVFAVSSAGTSSYSSEVNATPTAPVTYYVASSGSDTNAGTSSAAPWQTLTKVNSKTYNAGDSILFNGGDTFSGTLSFYTAISGASTNPVTVSSYGTGVATLNAGNSNGVNINNGAGFSISNLNFTGSGASVNTGNGISLWTNLSGNVQLSNISINNVTILGFGNVGISIGGSNGTSGFSNVSITNSTIHDNGMGGIVSYGPSSTSAAYSHSNITISNVTIYNILGFAGLSQSSGSGITLGSVNTATIQYSEVYNNGTNNTYASGGAGIWTYESTNITIQYNESHHNHTNGGDGDGFDLDGGVTNSVMQYNYSHDNDGAGYLLCTYTGATAHSGNIVRYNISENDARNVGYLGLQYGGIYLFSTTSNDEIYNNTIYLSPGKTGTTPSGISTVNWTAGSGDTFRNNIIQTTGGVSLISTNEGSGMLVQGNAYWPSGGTFVIKDNGTTYSSLAAWQSATGMEKYSGTSVGIQASPGLNNAGGGGTLGSAASWATLTAYQFSTSSPMYNAGLNLNSLFGFSIGSTDFYGNLSYNGTGYSIGAYEH